MTINSWIQSRAEIKNSEKETDAFWRFVLKKYLFEAFVDYKPTSNSRVGKFQTRDSLVFDTIRAFCRVKKNDDFELDVLGYASGHHNVFIVEVLNWNITHGVICIPRVRLWHKKHLR